MLLICHLKIGIIRRVYSYAITWSFSVPLYKKSKKPQNSFLIKLFFRSIFVKTPECSGCSFWRCSYLPSLGLLFASMVSPAPSRSARLESLLVNKPKTPLLPPEIQQVSSPRAHGCLCFQEARAGAQLNFRETHYKLCLALRAGSEAVNKNQTEGQAVSSWNGFKVISAHMKTTILKVQMYRFTKH